MENIFISIILNRRAEVLAQFVEWSIPTLVDIYGSNPILFTLYCIEKTKLKRPGMAQFKKNKRGSEQSERLKLLKETTNRLNNDRLRGM